MKASIQLITAFVFLSVLIHAQTVVKRETLLQKGFNPVINASGDKILHSESGFVGLRLTDLLTKQSTIVTEVAGAGHEPQFSTDGTLVFFKKTTFENNRRFNAVESYNIRTKLTRNLLPPQRILNKLIPLDNGVIAFSGRKLLRATAQKSNASPVSASANEDLKIMLFDGKNIRYLNPLAMPEPKYIWVSLSPDSKKILFTALGKGTYICDLNGKIISSLGMLNAPVWFDNNFVTGMEDKDDGHQITASKVVLVNIATKAKTEISLKTEIAMYPTAATQANRIAYQTEKGEIHVVDVKL